MKTETKKPRITGTANTPLELYGDDVTVPTTTVASFRYWLKHTMGVTLYEPQPTQYGQKDCNWVTEDSTGRYWQTNNVGSTYDSWGYIRSQVRLHAYQQLAHSLGYHLEDVD
jgi:hypothetical protein